MHNLFFWTTLNYSGETCFFSPNAKFRKMLIFTTTVDIDFTSVGRYMVQGWILSRPGDLYGLRLEIPHCTVWWITILHERLLDLLLTLLKAFTSLVEIFGTQPRKCVSKGNCPMAGFIWPFKGTNAVWVVRVKRLSESQ